MKYEIINDLILPEYMAPSTQGANSIDLRACLENDILLWPNDQVILHTGIKIALPYETMGMILPRSGLGVKGLVLGNLVGNIDPDYRGEVKVCLWNRSDKCVTIEPLDRIAQLVIVSTFSPTGWEKVDKVSDTKRGENGFGSTGVK